MKTAAGFASFLVLVFILHVAVLVLLLSSCTDTQKASIGAYGNPGTIKCYSGGKVIYEAKSTGIIQAVGQSDGWEFKNASNGKFVRVTGDCIIEN